MLIALMLSLIIGQTSPGAPLTVPSVVFPTTTPKINYRIYQSPAPTEVTEVEELVRLSDFIGFLRGGSPWNSDEILKIEALKGIYPIAPTPKKIKPYEDPFAIVRRPFWMPLPDDRQETLIFGRYVREKSSKTFEVITAFRVASDLDIWGNKTLVILNSRGQPVVERSSLKTFLIHLIKGEKPDANTFEAFEKSLRIADNGWFARGQAGMTYALRVQQAKELVPQIKTGMTREEVEKILPWQDGGISGPDASRYYFGAQVMIEIPYSTEGGAWKKTNRVVGKPRIYQDRYHTD